MRNRSSELDMSHALTANLRARYLNTAAITDNALIANTFVFTAMTFPITRWSEDTLTEKSVAFRF